MRKHLLGPLLGLMVLALAGCGGGTTAGTSTGNPPPSNSQRIALTDMGSNTYLGFSGGLYPSGSNTLPTAHSDAGITRANAVQPRDLGGAPDAGGKYVLLSIGMSNTTQEFCSQNSDLPCNSWTFMGQAAIDGAVNSASLRIVNGALGGQAASAWDSPADANYDRIRDTKLTPQGLSEAQVQVVWLKVADANPTVSLPSSQANAFTLETEMGNIVRSLKIRYPNLQQVFLSSRIYGGFATTSLNPEPYAYESGHAVKWLIEAQIAQMQNGGVIQDSRAGDLNYSNGVAPWIAWGPYLWANGTQARSDGLTWLQADFEGDGTHPSQSGETKVANLLLAFFKQSSHSKCWFVTGGACP